MVQIIEDIPRKEPIVERMKPELVGVDINKVYAGWDQQANAPIHENRVTGVTYNGRRIPGTLTDKLGKYGFDFPDRSRVLGYGEALRDFVKDKELYLRGKPAANGADWFALVTGEFTPIDSTGLDTALRGITTGQKPTVRYFRGEDTVTLEYKVDAKLPGMEQLHLHADLGKHGIWGGDGTMSVRYGLAHYNGVCTNWTLFLHEDIQKQKVRGKVLHRGDVQPRLDAIGASLGSWADTVVKAMDASKTRKLYREDLKEYFDLYASKRGMNGWIAGGLFRDVDNYGIAAHGVEPRGISVYDVAYRITELAQKRTDSDANRKRLEYLAGELILCTDKVLEAVRKKKDEQKPQAQNN